MCEAKRQMGDVWKRLQKYSTAKMDARDHEILRRAEEENEELFND